jgi:pyridoxamine 5'-phosphate oxidase
MSQDKVSQFVNQLRKEYSLQNLDETHVENNPIKQLEKWLIHALEANANEPNAMVLCTVSKDSKPSSRVVLLREFDENGLGFYTNFESRKGKEMGFNKNVCLNFFWPELERQIRIEGTVEKQKEEISDSYFASRPMASKIGAWASAQSAKIMSREILENEFKNQSAKFENKEVSRPPFWGGFLVKPTYFEFWQGRPSRLHDRICFELKKNSWKISRLSP